MIQNKRLSIFRATTFIGVLLILFGFFYLFEPEDRTKLSWLNLSVVIIVFLVNAGNGLLLTWKSEEFHQKIGVVGVLWFMDIIYSVIALGVLIVGLAVALPFKLQVVGQLTALFLLFVGTGWAITVKRNTEETQACESDCLFIISQIRREFEKLNISLERLGPTWSVEQARLSYSREETRYLAPVISDEARKLEIELQAMLARLSDVLDHSGRSEALLRTDLATIFDRIEDIIKVRKGCHSE